MSGVPLPGPLHRLNWRIPLIAAWTVFLLLPVWRTGWVGDDILNSCERGYLIHEGLSPVEHSYLEFRSVMSSVGRINPLIYFLKNGAFWLLPDLIWYKTVLVGMVLVNLVFFYRLLKRLGAGPDLAALCCLSAATLIQFRTSADPVVSFNGLMQWLFLATILSLGLYHRYLTGGGPLCLAASVLLYLAAALTYEMTYTFWILHCGVFFTTCRFRGRASTLALFAVIPLLLTLGSLWLRRLPECQPGVYSMSLDLGAVANTCLKQFVAALPCSYAALAGRPLMPGVFSWKTLGAHPAALVFGFLAALPLLWGMARRQGQGDRPLPAGLPILGVLLAILPVLMLSLARGYQETLHYGLCHLPVYIQYFGVALLLSCTYRFFVRRVRSWGAAVGTLVVLAAGCCAVTAVFHAEANARMVALWRGCLTPRREIEEVLDDGGLLAGAPQGALLLADPNPWDLWRSESDFYCLHTRTRWQEVWTSAGASRDNLATLTDRPGDPAAGPQLLRVRYVRPEQVGGYAVAGTVYSLRSADGVVSETELSQVRLAVRRKWGGGPDQPFVLHARRSRQDGADDATVRELTLRPDELRRTAETRNWTVYEFALPCPMIDGESVRLDIDPP